MNDYQIISQNVLRKRQELGLTQRELAQKAHVSDAVIRNIELQNHFPRLFSICQIADALGCDLATLCTPKKEGSK